MFRLGTKRSIHGITVSATGSKSDISFQKIEAALDLLQELAPARHRRILKHVPRILVFGELGTWGTWHRDLKLCQFLTEYLVAEETSVPSVACTLLHEATHAYLWSRNISYDESLRWRVEQICLETERHFARRLPVPDPELLDGLENLLAMEPEAFSNASRIARQLEALKKEDLPPWVISLVERLARRRLARHLKSPPNTRLKNPGRSCCC